MKFTHLSANGEAYMVDVTAKQPTVREATAQGEVACSPEVMQAPVSYTHLRAHETS